MNCSMIIMMVDLLLLLLLAATFTSEGNCQSPVAGTLFNSSEEIENITLQYYQALDTQFADLWLFPSVRFETNGTIIGWRFASTRNVGRGIPRLSVWSPDPQDSDTYILRDSTLMLQCVTSQATLPSEETVRFHSGGPASGSEGMMFSEGDIIGILFRSSSVASFVPYVYNTSIINPFEEQGSDPPLGFSLSSRTERVRLSLRDLEAATFLPMLALDLCVANPIDELPIQACVGNDSLDWESECEEPTSSATEKSNATTSSFSTKATKSPTDREPAADSNTLQLITIVVPAVGGPVLLIICLLVVVIVCCSCAWMIKKGRRKSTHTAHVHTDIPMESIDHNLTVTANGMHTYDSLDQMERRSTLTVSITNELYSGSRNRTNGTAAVNGNGHGHQGNVPSVAIYEQPVFSQSQYESTFNEVPGYDQIKPTNKHLKIGSLSPRVGAPLPDLPHPYGIDQLSPLMPRTPILRQTPPSTTSFYHTLETGHSTSPLSNVLGLSSTVTHTMRTRKENGDPGRSPTPKSSPEPRYRLRSSSRGMKIPNMSSSTDTQEPATPTTFFSLETGVYVPTQDQRNQFENFNMESEPIFDDTLYACLSQAPHSPFVNNWNFFEESESYWKPASDSTALYEQLSHRKYREILRKQIEITGHMGSGQFGKVDKGVWHTDQGDLDIAMKKLNDKASERDTVRFLQEAAIMGQFKHPNIVRLHGVVTVGSPVMIVLELMRNGDLRNYLKSLRPVPGEMIPGNLPQRLLDFCSQIALGMEYLSRKDFVHRDLATRNILLTEDYVCKIADFGMSRDLDDGDYYMSQGGMIPIKWTAPEALNFRKYSTASDVWSFGVLVYEIWSLGHTPFRNKTPEETISLVESSYRLPPPPGCPRAVYHLMINCWHPESSERPTFTKLVQSLSQPEEVLLKWTSEDSNIHAQVISLGAPLEMGDKLYPELSKMYIST